MPKQKIEIEVDVPEGYEATGEYRKPAEGEPYLSGNGEAVIVATGGDFKCIILRRVVQYREPVLPADAWKQCEMRDGNDIAWKTRRLVGWTQRRGWIDEFGSSWMHCRIEKESS